MLRVTRNGNDKHEKNALKNRTKPLTTKTQSSKLCFIGRPQLRSWWRRPEFVLGMCSRRQRPGAQFSYAE